MRNYTFTALALAYAFQITAATSCEAKDDVKITFYGWPDNSPPGPANAFDCGRGKDPSGEPIAGGTGTYTDPISFATATNNKYFPQCGIVYVPSLRKYFRNEDDCEQCTTDFGSGAFHIDLWTGSNTQGGDQKQIDCEDSLPGGQLTIINDPPDSLPVDTTAFFDVSSGSCSKTTYPVTDASSLCSGSSGGPPPVSPPVILSSSSTTAKPSSTPTTLSTAISPSSSAASSGGTVAGCTWPGHCLGAPCHSENDCDGTNVCGSSNVCVALGSS